MVILVFTSKIRDNPTCLRFSRRGNGYFHCGFRFYIILGYLFNIITPNLNAHTSSNEKEKKIKKTSSWRHLFFQRDAIIIQAF